MSAKQNGKEEPDAQSLDKLLASHHQKQLSIDTTKYLNYMSPLLTTQQIFDEIQEKCSKSYVSLSKDRIKSNVSMSIPEYSSNKEVLTLLVQVQNFIISIYILNVEGRSKHHQLPQHFSGNFGTIYKVNVWDESYAIKCCQIKNNFAHAIKSVINEYIIFTIAALLEAGPSMKCLYGFNIIIYSECIEFTMEFCDHNHYLSTGLEDDLKSALRKLHHFKIIHHDIKPENICFSHTFHKYVFIDFGLSKVIEEDIGEATLANFRGSLSYCSQEMFNTYLKNTAFMVDLYYNDAHCLVQSLSEISRLKVEISQQQISYKSQIEIRLPNIKSIEIASKLIKFKCELYRLNYWIYQDQMQDLFKQNKDIDQKYQRQILAFCQSLQFNPIIEQMKPFYLKQNMQEKRDNVIFTRDIKLYKKNTPTNELPAQSIYQIRYQTLLRINDTMNSVQHCAPSQIKDIFNAEKVRNMQVSLYLLALAHFIDIYNDQQPHSRKIEACKIMCSVFKEKQQIQDEGRYLEIAFEHLFDYSFERPTTSTRMQILQKTILPVIIMQIKSQEQITDCFSSVFSFEASLVDRLGLMLEFMTAIIWISQKYKTRYRYYALQKDMVLLSLNFLKSVKPQTEKQSLFVKMAVDSISLPYSNQDPDELTDNVNYYYNLIYIKQLQQKELFNSNYIYLFHNFFLFMCEAKGINPHWILIPFQKLILKHNQQHSHRFSYYHFLLYRLFDWASIHNNLKLINQKMQLFFKDYRKYYHYKMKCDYQMLGVRANLQNVQQIRKYIFLQFQQSNIQSKLFFADILTSLQSQQKRFLIKNQHKKNQISSDLIKINLVKQFQKYQQLLSPLFLSQFQKIYQQLPKARHLLSHQVSILNKVFLIVCEFKYQNNLINTRTIDSYLTDVETIIRKENCFQCTLKSFLKLLPIRAIKEIKNNKWDNACELYFQAGLVCVKSPKNFIMVSQYSLLIISLVKDNPRTWQRYDPYLLNHYFIQAKNQYESYLSLFNNHSLVYIYRYFYERGFQQQLLALIQNLLKVLKTTNSSTYCEHFYGNIVNALKYCLRNNRSCLACHQQIINSLQTKTDNVYVGFYFSALLLFSQKPSTQFLLTICISLNRINVISRLIIFNTFYLKLLAIFQLSKRKQQFFMRKHLKFSANRTKFKLILQLLNIGHSSKNMHYLRMKNKLHTYYTNADNTN